MPLGSSSEAPVMIPGPKPRTISIAREILELLEFIGPEELEEGRRIENED
jgi:hypothetical protein